MAIPFRQLQPPKLYSIDYFIKHFEEMHEDDLGLSTDTIPSDAWEWLEPAEASMLYTYIRPFGILIQVNDGEGEWISFGHKPQQRVVAFLKWVKEQYKEYR